MNVFGMNAFSNVNQYQVKVEGDTGGIDFQHLVLFGGAREYTGP